MSGAKRQTGDLSPAGGISGSGRCEVTVAKNAGFCPGVRHRNAGKKDCRPRPRRADFHAGAPHSQ